MLILLLTLLCFDQFKFSVYDPNLQQIVQLHEFKKLLHGDLKSNTILKYNFYNYIEKKGTSSKIPFSLINILIRSRLSTGDILKIEGNGCMDAEFRYDSSDLLSFKKLFIAIYSDCYIPETMLSFD
eukprot:NODE_595_length_5602_cov_0.719062.p5 type:complete len:126 gc:universal NODE_595_length_5602_cov_0.719062:5011-4634(-)